MEQFKKCIPKFWVPILFAIIYSVIFYKVILYQIIPFPSDLLVARFFPYNSGGWEGYSSWTTYKEFIAADVVRQLYPWRILAMENIKNGVIPLWNIYAFSGTPLLANVQSAVFYPLNILFFIFNSKIAWTAYILFQPVLAFVFMYLFVRSLSLSKQAGFLSALAFGFIGYIAIWFELGVVGHTALWLPFILWGIVKYKKTAVFSYLLLSSLGIAMSLFAGHAQTAAYNIVLAACFYIFMCFRNKKKEFLKSASFLLLGVGIAAVQIVPSLELMNLSARQSAESAIVFHKFQLPIQHLVTILVHDFFGNPATNNFWGKDYGEFMVFIGVVAFIFAIVGICSNSKNRIVRFFLFAMGIALLFALPTPLSNLLYSLQIPIFGTGIPSRALFIVEFSLVVLAAFGMEQVIKREKIASLPLVFIAVLYGLIWIFLLLSPTLFPKAKFIAYVSVAKRNTIIPSVIAFTTITFLFVLPKFRKWKHLFFGIIIIIAAFEYQYFLYKFSPFSKMSFIFPSHKLLTYLQKETPPYRVYGYDTARIETNLSSSWRFFSPEGYDPLYIKRYGELLFASQKESYDENIQRSDALFSNTLPKEDSLAKKTLFNIMGVRYILDKTDNPPNDWHPEPYRFPQDRFSLIWQAEKWKVYENKQVLPRAVLFYDYVVLSDNEKIIQTLFDEKFPYSKKIILEEQPKDFISSDKTAIAATIMSYKPNSVTIRTDSSQKALLFLSDNYYPGWKAYVDNKETKIYRSHYTFRSIVVPKGKHIITFSYIPQSFLIGLAVTAGSVLGILYLFWRDKKVKI